MESNLCSMNQLDSYLHLPPRKRLLAGLKKQNSYSNGSYSSPSPPPPPLASSSSTSNGSSSASTDPQTNADNLLASRFNNDQYQSPEEHVEAARSAADLAVKAAKEARGRANEKALISEKAIAAAKRALELVDSFGGKRSLKKNKRKKHVALEVLYSKGELRDEEEDVARRLHRDMDSKYPRVLRICSGLEEYGHRSSKKQKTVGEGWSSSIVTGCMNDNAGVVDSDCSYEELESNRKTLEALNPYEADSDATVVKEEGEIESNSFGICNSKDQENGVSIAIAQPREDGCLLPVSSWKCQELKAPECVKQNEPVRSS